MRIGIATDIGKKRTLNEDSYFVNADNNFLCGFIADGMGGYQAGEIASKMAADFVWDYIIDKFEASMDYVEVGEVIRHAFVEANNLIFTYASENERLMGMGCTSTLAMIYQNKLITAHVGDSRVYVIGEDIKQITKDHTYVQELLIRGDISEELAQNHPKKHYITRAMGTEETIKVDIGINTYNEELVIMCSDGLTNMLSDVEIKEIITKHEDLQKAAEDLVKNANDKGGFDNITVILFDATNDRKKGNDE